MNFVFTPAGGQQLSGGPTGQHGRSITGHYFPGGAMGEPQPEPMPSGPIQIVWRDAETGEHRSEVMEAIAQMAEDPPGITINPGSIGWEQVIAWLPLSEAEADL